MPPGPIYVDRQLKPRTVEFTQFGPVKLRVPGPPFKLLERAPAPHPLPHSITGGGESNGLEWRYRVAKPDFARGGAATAQEAGHEEDSDSSSRRSEKGGIA